MPPVSPRLCDPVRGSDFGSLGYPGPWGLGRGKFERDPSTTYQTDGRLGLGLGGSDTRVEEPENSRFGPRGVVSSGVDWTVWGYHETGGDWRSPPALLNGTTGSVSQGGWCLGTGSITPDMSHREAGTGPQGSGVG